MSRDWPDKREQEIVLQVEAEGCVKTPKKALEEPSEVGVLEVREREVRDEAGRRGGGRAAQPGARGGSPQGCLALAWGHGWLSLGQQGPDFVHTSSYYHSS